MSDLHPVSASLWLPFMNYICKEIVLKCFSISHLHILLIYHFSQVQIFDREIYDSRVFLQEKLVFVESFNMYDQVFGEFQYFVPFFRPLSLIIECLPIEFVQ